jgi:hemoglobin
MTEPQAEQTQPTPYELIGGEAALHRLVDRFYQYMNELPEARPIRKMHAADLSGANSKLFMFLSGWLGGPNLFWEAYGHPRLRSRHFPFEIGISERDQWVRCMRKALDDTVTDEKLREPLYLALAQIATNMINRPVE